MSQCINLPVWTPNKAPLCGCDVLLKNELWGRGGGIRPTFSKDCFASFALDLIWNLSGANVLSFTVKAENILKFGPDPVFCIRRFL